jgi:hypothetical protein
MRNLNFNFYKDWIFINIFNIISINWENRKDMKAIKEVFIPLKRYFKFTRRYAPFMFANHYGKLFSIIIRDVQWKDKNNTPRHEENPFISIALFNKFFFNWSWGLPKEIEEHWIDNDDYWEQGLWWLYYSDKNINKAKETWPWTGEDNKSTWKTKFIR